MTLALGSLWTACSNDQNSNAIPASMTAEQSPVITDLNTVDPENSRGSLLFFMNPYGRPCQMQESNLKQVQTDISQYADIVYVRTDRPQDKSLFYEYGIRSLPSLVLVNKDDQVVHRFTPGIQQANTILNTMKDVL
jgi:hypothetical protein